MTNPQQFIEESYHPIEKVLTDFKNGATYSDSIEKIQTILEQAITVGKKDERQFILNILDGINKADEEMGNKGGGTKAIRLALQSRLI